MKPIAHYAYGQVSDDVLQEHIRNHQSFELYGLDSDIVDVSQDIGIWIEQQGLTYRLYTRGRWLLLGSAYWSIPIAVALGMGILAHLLLTANPDYEICRDLVNGRIQVDYC